jgi:hypothetical protein
LISTSASGGSDAAAQRQARPRCGAVNRRLASPEEGQVRALHEYAKRNIHCVLSDASEGFITGFGMRSYVLGLDAMLEILRARRRDARS